MICVSAVGTGRYSNLQVVNSGDDRSKCPDVAGLRPSAVSRYPLVRTE